MISLLPLTMGATDARANWTNNCVQCHGPDGRSNTPMGKALNAKNLTDTEVQASFSDAQAVDALKNGVQRNGAMVMTPFGAKFSDEEIKALIAYVRTLKK